LMFYHMAVSQWQFARQRSGATIREMWGAFLSAGPVFTPVPPTEMLGNGNFYQRLV
jgi:hypothetical protein